MIDRLLAWFRSLLSRIFRRRPPPPPLLRPPEPRPTYGTKLFAAIEDGDLRGVEEALARGAPADCRNEQGLTALGIAVDLNQSRIVRALIDQGAPINGRDGEGKPPLLRAAEHGHDRIVELLIEKDALVDVQGPEGVTPLIAAAWKGHTEVVRALVEKGHPALDACDDLGRTALMGAVNVHGRNSEMAEILRKAGAKVGEAEADLLEAATRGDLPGLRELLRKGASPRVADGAGNTPLILAASRGWTEVAAELLAQPSINRNAWNHEGCTALVEASRAGHHETVKLLLDKRAEVDLRNKRGETALILAAAAGRSLVVERLLAHQPDGPEVDARDEDGRTALLAACASGSPAVVQSLLKHVPRPNVDVRARYGNRPLMVSILAGATQVAGLLREAGARQGEREALLVQAARRGDAERVRELIGQGVEVDAQDLDGRTALLEAAEQGFADVLQALVDSGATVGLTARDRAATALGLAARGGWMAALEILLPRLGPEWERQVAAALLEAVRQGHSEAVRFLVEKGGAGVDARSRSGDTPLTAAVAEGQLDVARTLLDLGAKVDLPGRRRNTPLMIAILEDRPALADLLVEWGAKAGRLEAHLIAEARRGDVSRIQELLTRLDREAVAAARDRRGGSVLLAACAGGNLAAVELLDKWLGEDAGPMLEAGDREGRTPLMAAAQAGRGPVVDFLLGRHVRVDARSYTGRTPLMEAVRSGHRKIVLSLLKGGADPNARDQKGGSPLKEALLLRSMAAAERKEERRRRFDAVVTLLESHGGFEGAREARLIEAAGNRDLPTLQELLLRQRVNPETADLSQRTALILAAEGEWLEGVDALLSAGAHPDTSDAQGRTPLWLAARNGHLGIVEALFGKRADPSLRASGNRTPLLEAAEQGHARVVERLIEAGASANVVDDTDTTPLMAAARKEHLEVLAFLAGENRSDLDTRDREGRTALTWARLLRNQDLEKILHDAGARAGEDEADLLLAASRGDAVKAGGLIGTGVDVRVRDGEGNTALHLAARGGHAGIAGDLLTAGAGPDARNRKHRTPLLEAAQGGHLEVVRTLLPKASLAARDLARDTALHHAARAGSTGVVEALAEADADAVNRKGETPLLLAVRGNYSAVAAALLARGADPDQGDVDGRTPLMDAAERGYLPLLELLLAPRAEGNVNVNAVDHQGRTAWDLASAQRRVECLRLLEQHGARAADPAVGSVYVTPHGDRYHRQGCGSIQEAQRGESLERKSRARALAEGYDPCLLCRPDAEEGGRVLPEEERVGAAPGGLHFTVFYSPRIGPQDTRTLVAERSGSELPLPEGSEIRVVADVEGLIFQPREAVFPREGPVELRFSPDPKTPAGACQGWVHFWLGGMILAAERVSVLVLDTQELFEAKEQARDVWPYRKIFASYAREDEAVVQSFFRHATALGDSYVIDSLALRPGEAWEPKLLRLIEAADVFQLFWSENAAGSEHVKREWSHALGLRRPNFVRPVYWTDQLQPDPPKRLGKLHFARLSLAKAP